MNAQQQFAFEVFQMDEKEFDSNFDRIVQTLPTFCGSYEHDKIDTSGLYSFLTSIDYKDADNVYNTLAERAIMNQGFNESQASLIMSEAWDKGRSAGYTEIALYLIEVTNFCIEMRKRAS